MSIFKGHLRVIVLKVLADKGMGGYELCKKIEEETGWKPSFGSIYPLLNNLKEENMVIITEEGKKKIYSLTKKGKEQLKELSKRKDEFIDRITEMIKSMHVVCGLKEADPIIPFLEQMKKNRIPFMELQPEMFELRENLIKVILLKDKEKNKKLRKILKEINQKVVQLQ